MEKSAFARETQVEAPSTLMSFAENFVVTGHYRMAETMYVNVLNKQSQERLTFSSDEQDGNRPKVISLTDDVDPLNVKAVLQLGVQTATVTFDRPTPPKASIQAQAAAQAPANPQFTEPAPATQSAAPTDASATSTPGARRLGRPRILSTGK